MLPAFLPLTLPMRALTALVLLVLVVPVIAVALPHGSGGGVGDAIAGALLAAWAREGRPLRARHPALDAAARVEAASVAGGGSSARPIGVTATVIRREGFPLAGFSAGFWRTSAPRIDDPEAVLVSWQQVSPGFVREMHEGDWTHFGVGVLADADGTTVAVVVARDRAADLRRQAARYADVGALRDALHAAANAARAARELTLLDRDSRLDRAAQDHAEAMIEQGFYGHRAPDRSSPGDRARRAGFAVRGAVAENIAKGPFAPAETVDRWLRSREHRRNLLRPGRWSHGVGVAARLADEELEVVWVELFAR